MKTFISCKATAKGVHSFYMTFEGEKYFLFNQNYRRGVDDFFFGGVELNQAMRFSIAHHDSAIIRTMEKLPSYIKHVEKEYGIAVLNQTIKKNKQFLRYAA